jgi:peptidoglycan hydrolase CwlO-like protein
MCPPFELALSCVLSLRHGCFNSRFDDLPVLQFLQSMDPGLKEAQNVLEEIAAELRSLLKEIEEYQLKSSEKVFSMGM